MKHHTHPHDCCSILRRQVIVELIRQAQCETKQITIQEAVNNG